MPLSKIRKINESTLLGFWSITESAAELAALFRKIRPEQEIKQFKVETRQREWLASRILTYVLLQDFTSYPHLLSSDANGKPVFEGTIFRVSISHSDSHAAVLLSSCYEVGIDIEIIREKIMALATKFLSEEEQKFTGNDLANTCLYWSAKETLYKMYSRKQLLFRENLALGPVNGKATGILDGKVITDNFKQSYAVHYEKNLNFILTYCLALPQPAKS